MRPAWPDVLLQQFWFALRTPACSCVRSKVVSLRAGHLQQRYR
jgi:hypothetical protein